MDRRPNVLLIMTDQQKADSLRLYGNSMTRTPAIDRLVDSGVAFDAMTCNYPACTPGRSAVMTGRYPHTNGVRANHLHLPNYEITLPQLLGSAGYRLGLVGKNHVFPDGSLWSQFRVGALALRDFGNLMHDPDIEAQLRAEGVLADQRPLFDTWYEATHFAPDGAEYDALRKFAAQARYLRSYAGTGTIPLPAEQTTSLVLGDKAADYVRRTSNDDRPWFLWLSFPDPHNPYVTPEPYASMYEREAVEIPPDDPMTDKPMRHAIAKRMNGMHVRREEVIREAVAIQFGQVTAIDDGVAKVMTALAETGQLENTIVIYTTDHGGYVGDHGAWHKSLAFFECLIRLPLIVSWPGTIAPKRCDRGFVEQVDLLPTILELVDLPKPPGVQGRSMAPALVRGAEGTLRDYAFAEGGEAGNPVTWDDLPFMPEDALDSRYYGWDGFQEAWIGQGKMVRDARWKYVWWANGEEELYDLSSDPDELVNLAGRTDPTLIDHKCEFTKRLLLWSVSSEDQLAPHTYNVTLADVAENRLTDSLINDQLADV